LRVFIAADYPELDAQIPAESAAGAEARLQVVHWRRRAASQDVRLPGDSLHRCHRLPESAGTNCTDACTHTRAPSSGHRHHSGAYPRFLLWGDEQ